MPDLYSALSVSYQPLLWTQLAELLLKAQDAARWSIQDILDRQDDPYTQDYYYMYKFNAYKAAAKRYRSSDQVHTHCMKPFSKASSNSQAAISSMINQTRLCSHDQHPDASPEGSAERTAMPLSPAGTCVAHAKKMQNDVCMCNTSPADKRDACHNHCTQYGKLTSFTCSFFDLFQSALQHQRFPCCAISCLLHLSVNVSITLCRTLPRTKSTLLGGKSRSVQYSQAEICSFLLMSWLAQAASCSLQEMPLRITLHAHAASAFCLHAISSTVQIQVGLTQNGFLTPERAINLKGRSLDYRLFGLARAIADCICPPSWPADPIKGVDFIRIKSRVSVGQGMDSKASFFA